MLTITVGIFLISLLIQKLHPKAVWGVILLYSGANYIVSNLQNEYRGSCVLCCKYMTPCGYYMQKAGEVITSPQVWEVSWVSIKLARTCCLLLRCRILNVKHFKWHRRARVPIHSMHRAGGCIGRPLAAGEQADGARACVVGSWVG